jgi:hygromycin-B 4-O-kinase
VKPSVSLAAAAEFLADRFSEPKVRIERLREGMESQAFRFDVGDEDFVLRIGSTRRGFEKDRWASAVAGRQVPVPVVFEIGSFDEAYTYCITHRLPGTTHEDLAPADAAGVVGEVAAAWAALASSDVNSVVGVGNFDAQGNAPANTWRAVLLGTLEAATAADDGSVLETYARLVERCPEERALVHGDFGSNNVLVHDGEVSGVLDWECAMVGDPLHDVANTRFWATYLPCMHVQAAHFDRTLRDVPDYRERVLCYALRIGVEEAREARRDGDAELAEWASRRCRELIAVTALA